MIPGTNTSPTPPLSRAARATSVRVSRSRGLAGGRAGHGEGGGGLENKSTRGLVRGWCWAWQWWVARQRAGPLVIHGREASSGRTFTQWIGLGVGDGQYPSRTVVPSAGCWTLTATIGGEKVGAITVPVAALIAGR